MTHRSRHPATPSFVTHTTWGQPSDAAYDIPTQVVSGVLLLDLRDNVIYECPFHFKRVVSGSAIHSLEKPTLQSTCPYMSSPGKACSPCRLRPVHSFISYRVPSWLPCVPDACRVRPSKHLKKLLSCAKPLSKLGHLCETPHWTCRANHVCLVQTPHMLRAIIHTTIHVIYCSTLSPSYQFKGTHAYASSPALVDSDPSMYIQAASRNWVSWYSCHLLVSCQKISNDRLELLSKIRTLNLESGGQTVWAKFCISYFTPTMG